jgi:TonB family protein
MSRHILSRVFLSLATVGALASHAWAQSPYQIAALPAKSADTERVLTFGPASFAVSGPKEGQISVRATELDLEVKVVVERDDASEWVAKAAVMLLLVGNKHEPLPMLRGQEGGVGLRSLTAWGTPRYELKVSDRDRKRQVVAELSLDEATDFLTAMRAMAPPREAPKVHSAVDRPVVPRVGNRAPHYPAILRNLGVSGEVVVRVVVDTTGRVAKGSFEVVRASDDRLVRAVRDAVTTWRFTPAELAGARVLQRIELPFVFAAEQRD